MPKSGPPDRWLDYSKVGEVIAGTPFIAFKVPLKEAHCRSVGPQERFTPSNLLEQYPNLGLVIDLTFTARYYEPMEFLARGVKHCKILCAGHGSTPKDKEVKRFTEVIDSFLEERPSEEKLVGVHCTHGLNRTGYMICRYMIDRFGFSPEEAVRAFEKARGHNIERKEYLEHLGYINPSGQFPARERSDHQSRKNHPSKVVQERPSRGVQEQHSYDYETWNQDRHIPSNYGWSNEAKSLSNPYQYDAGNAQKGGYQQFQDGRRSANVQRDSYQQHQYTSYKDGQDGSLSRHVQRDSRHGNVQKDSYQKYSSNSGNVYSDSYQQYQDGSHSGNAQRSSYQQSPSAGYYKQNSDGYMYRERQQDSSFQSGYKKPYNNPSISNGQQPNRHYRFDSEESSSQQEDTTTAQMSCWF